MAKVPVSEQVQVNFRMPEALRDQIKQAAKDNSRSMNAEIIHALELYYSTTYLDLDTDAPPLEYVSAVNTPEDARKAAARMSRRLQRDLEKTMLEWLNSPKQQD
jgi:hypothetical protein